MFENFIIVLIDNGNRTMWCPIRSVIIRVLNKMDECQAGVRFVNHETRHENP